MNTEDAKVEFPVVAVRSAVNAPAPLMDATQSNLTPYTLFSISSYKIWRLLVVYDIFDKKAMEQFTNNLQGGRLFSQGDRQGLACNPLQ